MPTDKLDQLALAWENWTNQASPARFLARARMYLVFLLIRHGGLRLNEALNTSADALDRESGLLRVVGAFKRRVLLPFHSLRQFRRILALPEASNPDFLRLDPASVRRAFYAIAASAGYDAALAAPRALRYLRGMELLEARAPLSMVQDYLGLARPAQISAFLKFCAANGQIPANQPPNSFMGLVESFETGARSALIRFKSFSGLKLFCLSAMREFTALEPRPGLVVQAEIDPARIRLSTEEDELDRPNRLQCEIETLKADNLETFATLRLITGEKLRAEMENSLKPCLARGMRAIAAFPARAVQLKTV